VRYADFVMGFAREEEARRVLDVLQSAWASTVERSIRTVPRPRRRRPGLWLLSVWAPSLQPRGQGVLVVLPAPGQKSWLCGQAAGMLSPGLAGCGTDLSFQQVRPAETFEPLGVADE
jgi:hypothetical protein